MTYIAIIPVRKGSKRIPQKNYQKIGKDTLIERKIKQLKQVKQLSDIVLASDDQELEELAVKYNIAFIRRKLEYCDEISRTPNEMIKNILGLYENLQIELDNDFTTEHVVWTHCTNPYIASKDYSNAIKDYEHQLEVGYCSLFSVNRLEGHFWNSNFIPLNYSPMVPIHQPAKELPNIYEQNGGIFIRPFSSMLNDGSFLGKYPYPFVMDSNTGLDIDYPEDLEYAQFLYKKHIDKYKIS